MGPCVTKFEKRREHITIRIFFIQSNTGQGEEVESKPLWYHTEVASVTLICLFMVMQNKVMKYMTRIGQNTGTLNTCGRKRNKRCQWIIQRKQESLSISHWYKQGNRLGRSSASDHTQHYTTPTWKNVQKKATRVDLVTLYQNLNSGSRRMKGRNSSLALVGSPGPSSGSRWGKKGVI